MSPFLHPIVGVGLVALAWYVAALGWRSRLAPRHGAGEIHAWWGHVLLAGIGITWLAGIASAWLQGGAPAQGRHFWLGTAVASGFALSWVPMVARDRFPAVRWVHATANILLLLLLLVQLQSG